MSGITRSQASRGTRLAGLVATTCLVLAGCDHGARQPRPELLALVPSGGSSLGNVPATLTGVGFDAHDVGTTTVTFDGIPATGVLVLHDTTISCMAPPGTPGMTVDVVVSNNHGSSSLSSSYTYFEEPTLASLAPESGTALGGTTVTLTGTGFSDNFAGENVVLFDGVAATDVLVVDDTTLTCVSPIGTAGGTVDVTVSNVNGSDPLAGSFRYHEFPTITGVVPNGGSSLGGTSITMTGTGFQADDAGTNEVLIGGVPATDVVVVADGQITFTSPPGVPATLVGVAVSNENGGASLSDSFTIHPLPSLTNVDPPTGSSDGGTVLTLIGSGFFDFSPGVNTVLVGGAPATGVVVSSDTELQCSAPAGVEGATVDVEVSNANGSSTLAGAYTFTGEPTITGIVPPSGPLFGGYNRLVQGSGFTDLGAGTPTVSFGGSPATAIVVLNGNELQCTVPAGAIGLVDVTVTTGNGSATLTDGFEYEGTVSLSAVTPGLGSALGGTSISLTGSGFQSNSPGGNTVTVDGVAATGVAVVSDTQITCTTPAGAAGTTVDVAVANANGSDTLASGFTYFATPTLTSISPSSGTSLGGTSVTLTGTGFQNNSPGTNSVTIDGTAATNIVVVSDTQITCESPAGTAGTSVDVIISNDNGSATFASSYTYFGTPTLASISPSTGFTTGGTSITLTGTGFQDNSAGTPTITLDGVAATGISVVSDTSITCTTPAGSSGEVDVQVSNANGSATLSNGFEYIEISASLSSLAVSSEFGALADGVDTVDLSVVLRGTNGSLLSGQPIALSASGLQNTLTPASGTTDGSGSFSATIATSVAERKTLTVLAGSGALQVQLEDRPATEFIWPNATRYYVRTTGSDANDGSSPSGAWATIGMAFANASPGDTIYVGAGTYTENIFTGIDGTASDYIRFVGDRTGAHTGDAGDVVVDGGTVSSTLFFNVSSYIIVEGFDFTGSCTAGYCAGVYVQGGTQVVLRDNRIYGNSVGVYYEDGAGHVLEDNIISNNIYEGSFNFDAEMISMVNNLVYGNGGSGFAIDLATGVEVINNTFYANGSHQLDSSNSTVTATNNIVAGGAGFGVRFVGAGEITSTYNDVWNNASGDYDNVMVGTGDISADPLFNDVDGPDNMLGGAQGEDDDFRIDGVMPSPAVDVGSVDADEITLTDGSNLADKTTDPTDLLEGNFPEVDTVNLGFHYPVPQGTLPEVEAGDARIANSWFDSWGERTAKLRTWDSSSSTLSSAALGYPVGTADGTTRGVRYAISPLATDEELLVQLAVDATTELDVHRWTGVEWSLEWSSSSVPIADARHMVFDVAYEETTGDALVVYSNGTTIPAYRTFTKGVWSDELNVPVNDAGGPDPDITTGIPQWVELEARPSTDEIALAFVDDNDDLGVIVWEGSAWSTASAAQLEPDVHRNPSTLEVDNRAFDLAFEAVRGDLFVCWGRDGVSGAFCSIKPAGSNVWGAAIATTNMSGPAYFVDLDARPGTNMIAGAFMDLGGGTERMAGAIWNGTSLIDDIELDSQTRDVNDNATGDFPCGVAWVSNTEAVIVYSDDNTDALDWYRWQDGSGWSAGADFSLPGKGNTESVLVRASPSSDQVMALVLGFGDLYGAVYSGGSWTSMVAGPGAIDPDVVWTDSLAFDFDFRR